ncbi:hypothetical protein C8N43_1003 [Litoreibacter ponti]|uniref:Uncharacterized protein n=1 Tax=Litoreibacter ponti TaxID=1510457 RepID=A0A2T6BJW3_9RHOB|nr:hypothetical protein [Litoreibacter ponti]PTX56346.1 hypothetical protein C8N43_1003 [Litoreibacter ponti]
MSLLEKARLNRRIALEGKSSGPRTPRDVRPVLKVILGGAARARQPSDFDPDLGMRLAA